MIGGGRGLYKMGVSRLYTRFIIVFIIVAIVLIFVIFYFSLSEAKIVVTPQVSTVTSDFIADIETSGEVVGSDAVKGVLYDTEVTLEQTYEATGTKDLEGDVIGSVTLINNLDRSQPLVATTRLLSEDKVLLHIKNRTEIPAHGKVEVEVYADDPDAFETVPPGKFSIPGLSSSLQEFIFGESNSTLSSVPGRVRAVKAVDIAQARDDLANQVYEKAIENFNAEVDGSYIAIVVAKKIINEIVGAEVDQLVDQFKISQTMLITVIGINEQNIVNSAADRLAQLVPDGMQLRNLNLNNLSYVVQNYDEDTKTANIKIHAEGETVLKENSSILDKSKLAGLSARGVELYLTSFDEVDSVQITLTPFWVKKVPSLPDHIELEIIN